MLVNISMNNMAFFVSDMPRKANSTSTKTTKAATNGGSPRKKAKLDVDAVYESDDDDDDVETNAAPSGASKDAGECSNEMLLSTIAAVVSDVRNLKYKQFDFGQVAVRGLSADQARAQYDRLRLAAFRNVRHLNMKDEIQLIRQYAKNAINRPANVSKKPKRPAMPYIRFLIDYKPKALKKHPELANNFRHGFMPFVADKWKQLDPEKKKTYEDAYKKELEEYYQQHPELRAKTPAPKDDGKGKATSRKRLMKPKCAFDLFSEAKRQEYAEKYRIKGEELDQKLISKFQKLSDRKRQKWEDRAREAEDEYIQALSTKNGSQKAAAETPPSDNVSNPGPAQSPAPAEKKEKVKRKKKTSTTDAEYDDFLDAHSGGESASKAAAVSKASKTSTDQNSWLY